MTGLILLRHWCLAPEAILSIVLPIRVNRWSLPLLLLDLSRFIEDRYVIFFLIAWHDKLIVAIVVFIWGKGLHYLAHRLHYIFRHIVIRGDIQSSDVL